MMIIIR